MISRRAVVADLSAFLRHPHPAIATTGLGPFEAAAASSALVDIVDAIPSAAVNRVHQNLGCLLHELTTDDDARVAFAALVDDLEDAARRCGVPADVIAQAMERMGVRR